MVNPSLASTYISWRMNPEDRAHNYGVMAEGYAKASDRLFASLLDDNSGHDADIIIFPIMFLVHQSIELYFKGTILYSRKITGEDEKNIHLKPTHDLEQLVNQINECVEDKDKLLESNETLSPLFEFLDLCKMVGRDSDGSFHPDFPRYPEHLNVKAANALKHVFVTEDNNVFVFQIEDIKKLNDDIQEIVEGLFLKYQSLARAE